MTHDFDKPYWEAHWSQAGVRDVEANPYLERELTGLAPGTAFDAGCGEGAEAIWLARRGWQVTAADISSEALARAAARSGDTPVEWIEADLSVWEPGRHFDLVMTHYAHPAMPQLDFYARIAEWVARGGTLLIVGHVHGHDHPDEASATAVTISALLDHERWTVATADHPVRNIPGRPHPLHDVVVRAVRRS